MRLYALSGGILFLRLFSSCHTLLNPKNTTQNLPYKSRNSPAKISVLVSCSYSYKGNIVL
jgi:hypothetical protein